MTVPDPMLKAAAEGTLEQRAPPFAHHTWAPRPAVKAGGTPDTQQSLVYCPQPSRKVL